RRQVDNGYPLLLPRECGRDEVMTYAFALLRAHPPSDYALDLCDLVRANLRPEEVMPLWLAEFDGESDKSVWLESALNLGILHLVSIDILRAARDGSERYSEDIATLMRGRRYDLFVENPEAFGLAL